ncbi:MAG: response regulator [Thermodesulfobacteriota bacterium]|nr:response regulator [Thermodesulfobacteriota bacterium]
MDSRKIMIVEDNTTVAEDCRECLEGIGYSVTSVVASGENAIENAEAERPDAVIMDIHLSGDMDGIEAAEKIHSRFGIPVVFLSAYSDRDLLERAKHVGSFGYLVKPFEERELYAALEMALYRSKTEKERKQAEQKERQIQKAESLNRMAGAIAHRFNNQLYVVIGNLELALEDLPADSRPRQCVTTALQAANRSAKTSGLMLTYLGQGTVKGEPFDLSDVCRRNLPSLRSVITDGIALETDLMDTGPIVRASTNQMQQVITHLITNAVEAIGDSGGKIKLATGTISADDILESHLAPTDWKPAADSYAFLEVTDPGCGIADEDMSKIFDPFFSTKFTGRGLGLAVILGIARQWGGVISTESREGHGTTFRVLFPVVDDAISLVPQKDTAVQPMLKGDSLLLVDDDDMVREMAEQMLKCLGYSVIAASGGAEALDLFNRHRGEIGCVLTDLSMPGMNGWETIAALRRIDPNIPIILSSGYDEARVMDGGQSERPQMFLHKPYALADLKAALSAVEKGAGKHE